MPCQGDFYEEKTEKYKTGDASPLISSKQTSTPQYGQVAKYSFFCLTTFAPQLGHSSAIISIMQSSETPPHFSVCNFITEQEINVSQKGAATHRILL